MTGTVVVLDVDGTVVVVLIDGKVEVGIVATVVVVVVDELNIAVTVAPDGNFGVTPFGSKANVMYMYCDTAILEGSVA